MRRTLWFGLIAEILAFPASALCQPQSQAQQSAPPAQSAQAPAPQQESLADAARRTRAQKKETPKTPK
ncbi:MAG: hypothetical protein WBP79_17385, partial [Candidatus Acidiferrales bacterium]